MRLSGAVLLNAILVNAILVSAVLLTVGSLAEAAVEIPLGHGEPLSQVIRTRRVGLGGAEDLRGVVPLGRLQTQVREFIRFRRDRMSPQAQTLALADCLSAPAENVFCELIAPGALARGKSAAPSALVDALNQLPTWLAEGDLARLSGFSESQFHRALRGFESWEPLRRVSEAIAKQPGCVSPSLTTALAQKAEEYFPSEDLRKEAERLYARAVACSRAGEESSVAKARFRLGLLKIWSGDCKSADALMGELERAREGDFTSRAIFWRAHCARQSGDKLGFAALKTRLRRSYPLSFHGLALLDRKERFSIPLLSGYEPPVQFRTSVRPELNSVIAAAELLQKERASDLSADLLEAYQEKFDQIESSVRLYVAVLYQRAGDRIGLFKTLSGIFQSDASVVSRATLEIFYPLQRFDLIRSASGSRLDPFLVAALIRQESGFNAGARSPAGAMGLMQLMPDTARRYGRVGRKRLLDPSTNVRVGTRYFGALLDRFQGDAELALAAYNAGPEKVDAWRRRYPVPNRLLFLDLIPYQETRNYVSLIGRNHFWYTRLYGSDESLEAPGRRPARVTLASRAYFPSLKIE